MYKCRYTVYPGALYACAYWENIVRSLLVGPGGTAVVSPPSGCQIQHDIFSSDRVKINTELLILQLPFIFCIFDLSQLFSFFLLHSISSLL